MSHLIESFVTMKLMKKLSMKSGRVTNTEI